MRFPFWQVDVFGDGPYQGNPLAVVLDADGLDGGLMAHISRWTNLSETVFVQRATGEADYRARIFSLGTELPFAGHPTLGTAHVVARARTRGDVAGLVQECGAGLIPVRCDGRADDGQWSFQAPPLLRTGAPSDADRIEVLASLGLADTEVLDVAWIDNGPGWLGVLVQDVATLRRLSPVRLAVPDVGVAALTGEADQQLEVRAFFTSGAAICEDPVTGSLNASLAQWLVGEGRLTAPYWARQGQGVGRHGRIHVTHDGEHVWVGGRVHEAVVGEIEL